MKITSRIERKVATIDENKTVREAVDLMSGLYIGSVVVTGKSGIRGLFTERDLMMRVVGAHRDPGRTKISEVMPDDPVRVGPNETSARCLELMKEHRCRHLLVMDGSEFVGIVSLRDIVALMLDEKEELISRMNEYISG